MLSSILIGSVAGLRSMTPLAAVTAGLNSEYLELGGLPQSLSSPLVVTGAALLAGAEMAGDKMRIAPDRTALPGMIGRVLTSAVSGAAAVERGRRQQGAVLAIAAAVASSYAGLALRKRAIKRYGRISTGLAEDALVLLGTSVALKLAPSVRRS